MRKTSLEDLIEKFKSTDWKSVDAQLSKMISAFAEGTTEWYDCQELKFHIQMRKGNYEDVKKTLSLVYAQPTFNALDYTYKDKWLYYRAYLGIVEPESVDSMLLNKLINHKVEYLYTNESEHLGFSIIQYFYLTRYKRTMEMKERYPTIERYMLNHMRRVSNSRSWLFMRIFCSFVQYKFSGKKAIRTGKLYMKDIEKYPIERENYPWLEIVDYNILWKQLEQELIAFSTPAPRTRLM
jgi:hypothetical protein